MFAAFTPRTDSPGGVGRSRRSGASARQLALFSSWTLALTVCNWMLKISDAVERSGPPAARLARSIPGNPLGGEDQRLYRLSGTHGFPCAADTIDNTAPYRI